MLSNAPECYVILGNNDHICSNVLKNLRQLRGTQNVIRRAAAEFVQQLKLLTQIIGEDFGSSNSSSLQGNFPEGFVAMT